MQRIRIIVLCLAIITVLGVTWVVADQEKNDNKASGDICIPMATFKLKAPSSVEAKRTSVDFSHPAHFNYKCIECHHTWDGASQIQGCMTADCHDKVMSPAKSHEKESADISYYMYAYHKQCRDCHKENKANNEELIKSHGILKDKLPKPGPTGCVECHPE